MNYYDNLYMKVRVLLYCQMSRNVNCTFHVKSEHSTNRERIDIGLAYIQSLDNPYIFVSLMHVYMYVCNKI